GLISPQVLLDFPLFTAQVTSDPQPATNCERYERTSLSDDGTTAEYDLAYTNAGDTTAMNDTSTFKAANNTVMYITFGNNSSPVYELTLDYVNGDQCFVGHCNCTETPEIYYYLIDNPDSDILEYNKCFNKIDGYSGGNITFLRDIQRCQNVPPKP
ncbi:hypothetical protein V5799_024865, partial [Amblyomma americanum]